MDGDGSLRGWPLGKPKIKAKYHAVVKKDAGKKSINGKFRHQALCYDEMLQQLPVTFSSCLSPEETYLQARSLLQVLHGARLQETSSGGLQSVPMTLSGVLPHAPRMEDGAASSVGENVFSAFPVLLKSPKLAMPRIFPTDTRSLRGTSKSNSVTKTKNTKFTKYFAKKLGLISNGVNTTPRRNYQDLSKSRTESNVTKFAVCGAEIMDKDLFQGRIQMHSRDAHLSFEEPPKNIFAKLIIPQDNLSVALLNVESKSPSHSVQQKMDSLSWRCSDYHGYSPSTMISEVVSDFSDLSIPETIMSSVDNFDENASKIFASRLSFSNRRQRWTSWDTFGSCDFEGELDIAGTIVEGRNVAYSEHPEVSDLETSSTVYRRYNLEGVHCNLDESNTPNSESCSPCLSSLDSSAGWVTDEDHHTMRGRQKKCGERSGRMKVTSPSSLFRDGPWYTIDKPSEDQASTKVNRKLTRKLSTSFSSRRKQNEGMTHADLRRDESNREGLTKHNTSRIRIVSDTSSDSIASSRVRCGNQNILQIVDLLSEFRSAKSPERGSTRQSKLAANVPGVSRQEAVTVFQDEIAQMVIEGGDIADIEEFLDGYMRLKSPFYFEVVEEFFRAISYDCYKRPLEVNM